MFDSGRGQGRLSGMRSDDLKDLPPKPVMLDVAAARAIGPEAAAEANWQNKIRASEWRKLANGRGPGSAIDDQLRLLRAVYAEPRLRRLYLWTSHYTLCFSLSTHWPWTHEGIPFTDPMGNGIYRVRRPFSLDVLGSPTSPEEAVALVVEHLPPDLGPLFNRPEG
ncbi:hypothetical protein ATKI12_5624 [Kitasatospora sp. Ki12]